MPHEARIPDVDPNPRDQSDEPSEGAAHELPLEDEIKRKALHLLALVVPGCMLILGRTWSLALLIPLATLAVAADVFRVRSASFARLIYSIFGFMMRPEERPAIGSAPVLNGATWVLITAALLAILFPVRTAVAAFAAFMVADAAAAIVGRSLGRLNWGSSPRTVEGSLAFVVVGTLVMAPITVEPLLVAIAAVLAGAVVEIPNWRLNDNIRVPLVMALVLYLL